MHLYVKPLRRSEAGGASPWRSAERPGRHGL